MNKQRLDKFVSGQVARLTRSLAREVIKKGHIAVNGSVCRDPSLIIDVDLEVVTLDGERINYKRFIYILMNKPKGVLSASNDKSRQTVVDLVPEHLSRDGLFPVGRLDRDTTGLLLITDDGEFAHNCISPKFDVPKTYRADLDGDVTGDMIAKFAEGITLVDGTKCRPAILERVSKNLARVTITEGKYHQVKRMFGVVGLGVNELHRERIGELSLPENLNPGECVELEKRPF